MSLCHARFLGARGWGVCVWGGGLSWCGVQQTDDLLFFRPVLPCKGRRLQAWMHALPVTHVLAGAHKHKCCTRARATATNQLTSMGKCACWDTHTNTCMLCTRRTYTPAAAPAHHTYAHTHTRTHTHTHAHTRARTHARTHIAQSQPTGADKRIRAPATTSRRHCCRRRDYKLLPSRHRPPARAPRAPAAARASPALTRRRRRCRLLLPAAPRLRCRACCRARQTPPAAARGQSRGAPWPPGT
jgi:hypothetical protein